MRWRFMTRSRTASRRTGAWPVRGTDGSSSRHDLSDFNKFATNSPALSGRDDGGVRAMSPTSYAHQLKAAERRLKLALEARDMDEIQAALRDLTRLQYQRVA